MTTGREPSMGGDKRIDTSGAEPELGGEAAILHMVEMLNHTDRKVRHRAALKLVEHGDRRVFDTLVEIMLDPENPQLMRYEATIALGQLGDERAIDPLVASTSIFPPYFVIKTLGQIGGDRAVDAILEIFSDNRYDSHVFSGLIETIPRMAEGYRAIGFLITTIENDEPGYYPEPVNGVPTQPSLNRTPGLFAAATLGKMGSQVIEPLLPLLDHESVHVQRLVIRALPVIEDERLIRQLASKLIDMLTNQGDEIKEDAARALGGLGDRRAVEPLIKQLNNYSHGCQDAAYALGELGDERAVEPLRAILYRSDQEIREYDHSNPIDDLENDAYRRVVWYLRPIYRTCIQALEKISTPEARDAIRGMPRHHDRPHRTEHRTQ